MMNTTMAPMEEIRQTLCELRRRHDSHHEISNRRKQNRTEHMGIEKRRFFRNGNSNKNNDNSIDGNRNGGGGSNKNKDGNGGSKDGSNDRSSFNFFDRGGSRSSSIPEFTAPPVAHSESSVATPEVLAKTSIETPPVTSLGPTPSDVPPTSLPGPANAISVSSPPMALRSSSYDVPTPSSITTSSEPVIAALPESTPVETTTQPRKELSDIPNSTNTSSGTPTLSTEATSTVSVLPEAETALSATSAGIVASPSVSGLGNNNKARDSISPLAERLLIAVGAIGAFIIFLAAIYFILRLRNNNIFLIGPRKKSRKSRSDIWHGRRKRSQEPAFEAPPRYSGEQGSYEYVAVEKAVPSQMEMEAFFSPKAVPTLATPARAVALSNADFIRQELAYKPLPSATEMLYSSQSNDVPASDLAPDLNKVLIQNGLLSRQLSDSYNITGTQNTLLTRPLSDSYNNTGTQVTLLTRQTTNIDNPSQREPNRMSQLSSLSSGFGDGLIIPEGGVTNSSVRHQSRNQRASRFSWQTSSGPRTPGMRSDRNSIFTTSSVESTPRFRTVNSWVAQQTGTVEKRQKKARDVPNRPTIPLPVRRETDHPCVQSDISAFQQHPGDEIEIRPGSRVPSSILDRKIGHS